MEKFDATGVTVAQPSNGLNPSSSNTQDHWVTVSPKKRVKALIHARPRRQSTLNPVGESSSGGNSHPTPSNFMPYSNPAPLGPDDIILANKLMLCYANWV